MWKMKWKLQAEAAEGEGSAPVVQSDVSPTVDSNVWDDLLDDDIGETAAEEEAVAEAAPEVQVSGEAEKAPEVAVEVVAPEPAVAEAAPVVEKPVEVVAQPQAPVVSPEPVVPDVGQQPLLTDEQRSILHQQAMARLQEKYKLSDEDAAALQVEPEKVLPKLAANLHSQIYGEVLQRIAQEGPALIAQTVRAQEATHRAEEAFYSRWGNLRQHDAEVKRVAVMWRQMYPNATLEEAIEGIGTSASALLGVMQQTQSMAPPPPAPPPPPAGPSTRVGVAPTARSRLSTEEQSFVDLAKTFEEEL